MLGHSGLPFPLSSSCVGTPNPALPPPFLTFFGMQYDSVDIILLKANEEICLQSLLLLLCQGEHCPCMGKESGQGCFEWQQQWGTWCIHHGTTALSNFGAAWCRVFRVIAACWDQYLAHTSNRHCKSCRGPTGFVSSWDTGEELHKSLGWEGISFLFQLTQETL